MRLLVLTSALFTFHAAAADIQQARELYQHTEYAPALKILQTDKAPTADVWALAGKTRFMLADIKDAIDNLQKAVELEPGNADYVLWLARAWGRKAEHSNPFTAMSAASRAHEYFEKAVALDPHSQEATGDLFDYYLEAPGFAGGGLDKAEALAHRIEAFDPSEGRFDLARVAARRKQFAEAEQDFRAALRDDPRATGHAIGFARFLAQQGRVKESDEVLAQAEAAHPGSVRLLFGRASIDVESHRNLDEARQLLDRYLASSLTPDDPSRDEARKLLHRAGGA